MRLPRTATLSALTVALSVLIPSNVEAQQPLDRAPSPAIEVTADMITEFIAVFPAVAEVGDRVREEARNAKSTDEARAILDQAQDRIAAVLDEAGLSMREYDAVVDRLNADPELLTVVQERIADLMQPAVPPR